ncbi:hypothetical protein RvY_08419 [Ramazzottius varieornatus]|uniref:Uncharacterized protein n=1 Tax=Ramazzottius varieornatus TaxID=947166 RepID=A0A1D1V826_RAMVA|nr:hypothetical protein RvY_08419 [Ramazzottius varieornatus]
MHSRSNNQRPPLPVRLEQPRPHNDRYGNEYVDAPKLPLKTPSHNGGGWHGLLERPADCGQKSHDEHHDLSKARANQYVINDQPKLPPKESSSSSDPLRKKPPCAIHGHLKDPKELQKKWEEKVKEESTAVQKKEVKKEEVKTGENFQTIICPECGKCQCSACTTPRKLPSTWICGGSVKCSGDNVVEALSCLCGVKAFLYHCTNVENEATDDPCSCFGTSKCCQRWSWMTLFSLTCMPCLMCYWPLKGAEKLVEEAYGNYHLTGCRCSPRRDYVQSLTSSPSTSLDSSPVASNRPLKPRFPSPVLERRPGQAKRMTSVGKS